MNDDELYSATSEDKKNEWLDFVKDVLCTASSYARHSKAMKEIPGFAMKNCLSLPGLGRKYFNSLQTEEDKPIYTSIDNT